MGEIMGWYGNASLYVFIGVFGGSTLLLFLICFCCQKKLQARTLAMADIVDVERGRAGSRAPTGPRRSDTHQLLPSIITPPPDYFSVVKKEDPGQEQRPPDYEAAVASLPSAPTSVHM